ncbi:MAG: rubrerythrin family protein [Anaerolineae bacterium]|nr:rubrerythrin family protein [Anaerolineae bacterium]
MNKTVDDLKAAFAGESQANRKYTAWSRKAEEEGHVQVAKLFRAVAAAETVHAINHFKALGEIKSTAENLEAAIAGEHYEAVTMYPEFMQDAEAEGERQALRSFTYAWEVEKIHEGLYKEALDNLGKEQGEVLDYWVCPVCGHTHYGKEPPEKCPICAARGERYLHIQ